MAIKKNQAAALAVLVIMTLLANVNVAAATEPDFGYMQGVMDLAQSGFQDISSQEMMEGAAMGIFQVMDEYTEFFPPGEAAGFLEQVNGSFAGVGIVFYQNLNGIYIMRVMKNSPAKRAGLLPGDQIVTIDGRSVAGKDYDDIAAMLQGESETVVTLDIMRQADPNLVRYRLKREEIKINPIKYEIRDGIGYIKIYSFNQNVIEYLDEALAAMDRSHISKIVIDLRGNLGGSVNQAVATAQRFVPSGLITVLDFRSPEIEDEKYYSDLEKPKYQVAVLVDEMSASASEILAGALQDRGTGLLVGTPTYGKSRFQAMIPILTKAASDKYSKQLQLRIVDASRLYGEYHIMPKDDELLGWVKMTIGEYYTPNGRTIDQTGLKPDIAAPDYETPNGIDYLDIDPLEKNYKYQQGDENIDIYSAKVILKLLGYEIDNYDLKMDEQTTQAIADYQASQGLFVYGVLDFATQEKLNSDLKDMYLKLDKAYLKAASILKNK